MGAHYDPHPVRESASLVCRMVVIVEMQSTQEAQGPDNLIIPVAYRQAFAVSLPLLLYVMPAKAFCPLTMTAEVFSWW